jgi:hypothetical protein
MKEDRMTGLPAEYPWWTPDGWVKRPAPDPTGWMGCGLVLLDKYVPNGPIVVRTTDHRSGGFCVMGDAFPGGDWVFYVAGQDAGAFHNLDIPLETVADWEAFRPEDAIDADVVHAAKAQTERSIVSWLAQQP